jgi:hypothetical protein
MKACGCNLNNAFMQHSLLALSASGTAHFRYRIDRRLNALKGRPVSSVVTVNPLAPFVAFWADGERRGDAHPGVSG